jgi:hypothetical protein
MKCIYILCQYCLDVSNNRGVSTGDYYGAARSIIDRHTLKYLHELKLAPEGHLRHGTSTIDAVNLTLQCSLANLQARDITQ